MALNTSSEVAKVSRNRGKKNSESAMSLLGSILDDSAEAAEKERKRLEENRKRAEEEEQLRKERETEMARIEAERAILAEQQAQEDLKLNQAKMQAQLQREKDIEAGLIDVEEEARLAREEEARKQAEAAEVQRKTHAKLQAIELKRSQESELEALKREQLAKEAVPPKSKTPMIVGSAIAALVVIIVAAILLVPGERPDPYALQSNYATMDIAFVDQSIITQNMSIDIVKQAEDPKPVKKPSTGSRKPSGAAAPEAPKPKPSLTGGKGGLFGGGKRTL